MTTTGFIPESEVAVSMSSAKILSRPKVSVCLVLGSGLYGGFSFHNKFIAPTTRLERPPSSSLLERTCYGPSDPSKLHIHAPCWSDTYQIILENVNITNKSQATSERIAKSLFVSSAFRVERCLLRKAGIWKRSEDELVNSPYHIEEEFGPFKVAAKTENQILFEWHDPYSHWKGITYLSADICPLQGHTNTVDITVQFGTGSVEPRQLPLMARVLSSVHGIYSRILLVSMADAFIADIDSWGSAWCPHKNVNVFVLQRLIMTAFLVEKMVDLQETNGQKTRSSVVQKI